MKTSNPINVTDPKQEWSVLCMFIMRDIDSIKSDVEDIKLDLKDYKSFNDKKVSEMVQLIMDKYRANRESIITMQVKVGLIASGLTILATTLLYLAKDIILKLFMEI